MANLEPGNHRGCALAYLFPMDTSVGHCDLGPTEMSTGRVDIEVFAATKEIEAHCHSKVIIKERVGK